MSIEQSLWFVDAEQASAFPSKKEGKKANDGMLLRKCKAGAAAHVTFDPLAGVVVEGVTDSGRPKKNSPIGEVPAATKAIEPGKLLNNPVSSVCQATPLDKLLVTLSVMTAAVSTETNHLNMLPSVLHYVSGGEQSDQRGAWTALENKIAGHSRQEK
ncbi:hypothetical protein BC835DRAFT_1455062 [Cytidiella melzeri]|nr:hypothetical protein BC835DRAFT_1455062 [Cytidiella melzeri]